MPADQLTAIATSVADALDYVHARGVVHRDVKPGNVLLPRSVTATTARARLADFGIARLVDATRLTSDGTLIGTAAYLSPEQARGGQVGAPSDVYSLGLMLLEALTGERAFPGTPLESASARIHRSPRIPDEVTREWRTLLTRMTAMEAADRPTARSVVLELADMPAGAAPVRTRVLPVSGADDLAPTAALTAADVRSGDAGTVTQALPAAAGATAVTVAAADRTAADPDSGTAAGPAVDATEAYEAGTPEPKTPARRLPVRALVAAGGVVVVAAVVLTVAVLGPGENPGPAPDYPEVSGEIGTHLERLQESVAP